MTTSLESLPKAAKVLPADAQKVWVDAYNADFGWRCSESHAEKAAWRLVRAQFPNLPAAPAKA